MSSGRASHFSENTSASSVDIGMIRKDGEVRAGRKGQTIMGSIGDRTVERLGDEHVNSVP